MLPVLHIRKPGDDDEQITKFPDDDPFFSEVSNLIDTIEGTKSGPEAVQILSSYEGKFSDHTIQGHHATTTQNIDAVKTYELTWAVRLASERYRAAKLTKE